MDNPTTAAALPATQFHHEPDGRTYEVVLPLFNYNGNRYTAAQAAADEKVRAGLVALAWESNEANILRDEAEFDENGILKIIY